MKNIIIPLGGLGIRFQEAHYTCPKPLVKVQGKSIIEWVLESIDIKEVIGIYISYHASLAPYHFDSFLQKKFPNYPIHCYCLNQNTKGAADTVFQTLSHFESLNEIDLDLPIISLDGDNFYTINIMELWKGKNNVFIFKDYQQNPIYSYISLKMDDTQENNNSIACIKEKEKISNMACTGAYAFKSGNLFIEYCRKVLQDQIATNQEYYISVVIQSMLDNTIEFEMLEILEKDYKCLGTPLQVRLFTETNHYRAPQKRYCFDLDNTLVTYPSIHTDYSSVKPIPKMIELVRMLYEKGNIIIIYTARRMKTHNGNMGNIMKDIGQLTFETLSKFNIPYHEIYFGKPYADFYIDDLAINAFHNVYKEIGYYQNSIECRNFHSLLIDKIDVYRKEGKDLSGEIHYYQNIPNDLKKMFPSLINYDTSNATWYSMEKIGGVVFSQLFVSQELKTFHLKSLLTSLNMLHHYHTDIPINTPRPINIYSNYLSKLKKRYQEDDYSIYPQSDTVYKELTQFLEHYQTLEKGRIGMIHGDPVFTNILWDRYGSIKLIDMRGKQGDVLSLYGDIFYDYAKVYQSLIGYDEILKGCVLPENYKKEMIQCFEEYIIQKFGDTTLADIKMITKTLLFTLLPLHKDLIKCLNYYQLIASIEI